MALATIQENDFEVIQYDEPEMFSKRHGNFRVGEKKESVIVELIKIQDPDELDEVIENFISSGERIVVLQTPANTPVCRYRNMISTRLLQRSKLSPMYRRVIVREYDNVLYLARRAFWTSKALPFEYSDELSYESEIGYKVRIQNESVRMLTKSLEHMSELTDEQLQEIAEWEANEKINELLQEAAKVIKIEFGSK